jgi:biopolymer transport protein ExbB
MKNLVILIAALGLIVSAPLKASENEIEAASLSQLLNMVKEDKLINQKANSEREAIFTRDKANQAKSLADAQRLQREEEARSERLENQFTKNETELEALQETLAKRLGSLRELFGVLQQVSGDTQGIFEGSIVSAEYPGRSEWLSEFAQSMGKSSKLASIAEIERLWFEIQREMTETGKITRFNAVVNKLNGDVSEQEVIRIGAYNLVSDGKYVVYDIDNDVIKELPAQPPGRFVDSAAAVQAAQGGFVAFGLDPTRGQLLELQIQIPSVEERIHQGGLVGYIIIAIGIVALLLSVERFVTLTLIARNVKAQIKNTTPTQAILWDAYSRFMRKIRMLTLKPYN